MYVRGGGLEDVEKGLWGWALGEEGGEGAEMDGVWKLYGGEGVSGGLILYHTGPEKKGETVHRPFTVQYGVWVKGLFPIGRSWC